MRHTRFIILLFVLNWLASAVVFAQDDAQVYPDPERFRADMDTFAAAELAKPSPLGAIVATGSSSMRGWHNRIAKDLAPLTIIPRGFGGSNMYDVRYFLDDLVLRYKPRAVMLYEGDNDAALGATPAQVLTHFDAIVDAIHQKLPETRIYVVAVKPSIARWNIWPTMKATNNLLQSRCDEHSLLTYLDVATPMLGADGKPFKEIFLPDMLHMKGSGYDIWRDAVRQTLLDAEAGREHLVKKPIVD